MANTYLKLALALFFFISGIGALIVALLYTYTKFGLGTLIINCILAFIIIITIRVTYRYLKNES